MSRQRHLARFCAILGELREATGGPRLLRDYHGRMNWPERGVCFFFEKGEPPKDGETPKVVRVGTHALKPGSKTTLWHRLATHRGRTNGTGNHRASINTKHYISPLGGSKGMIRQPKAIVPLLLAVLLSPLSCHAAPNTGRVRVIFLGEVAASNQLFLDWMEAEPKFLLTTIPCDMEWISLKEAKRFSRMYLPRTEDRLLRDYDTTVFEDFGPDILPLAFLDWTQAAISEGMGIALIEYANWGGSNEITRWMDLGFYDVFPANVVMNIVTAGAGRTFYRVENEGGPLNLPGIESVPMNQGYHGDLDPRPGATVEATWKGRQKPAMVTSTYGKGRTLQLDHGWDNIPGETRTKYEYLPDYIFNHIFCIAGISYPEDLEVVHITRASFVAYSDRKKATLAVLEFVERFGANPYEVAERLDMMDSRHSMASQLYLAGEYEEAGDELFHLLDEFTDIETDLMEAKDRALFWIYLSEWAVVVGVSALCGVALWTLMVKRRLYRDVRTTGSSSRN